MRLGRNMGDRAELCVILLLIGMLVFLSAFLGASVCSGRYRGSHAGKYR